MKTCSRLSAKTPKNFVSKQEIPETFRKFKGYRIIAMVKTLVAFSLLATPLAALSAESYPAETDLKQQAIENAFKIDSELNALTIRAGQRTPAMFPSHTANTIYGPTGLMAIPTSSVAADGSLTVGATFVEPFNAYSLNYGFNNNLEIGATYLDPDSGDGIFVGNAKLRIVPSENDKYEFAVGALGIGDDQFPETFYAVGSARLVTPNYTADKGAVGFTVHAGYGGGDNGGIFDDSFFFGGELQFEDDFSIMAEWMNEVFNAGVRFNINDDFTAQIGSLDEEFFFNLNYRVRLGND